VKVSNADKTIFPAIGATKQDLVDHYEAVAPVMVPWLEGRPLTLERYPNGVDQKGFLQKNASRHFPQSIERIEVPKNDGTVNHPMVGTPEDLVYLANQGTVTFHIWTSHFRDLDHPDHLVLDLDPSNEDLGRVREAVETSRAILDGFGMSALLVASGSRGFHLWTPIVPNHHHRQVARAGWCLAALIAEAAPRVATVEFLKRDRGDRVFIDWLRNYPGASIAAPYSLRPLPSAPVATPLRWQELDEAKPAGVTIRSIRNRILDPPELPSPIELDVDAIVTAADGQGIDPNQTVDRFGRKRS
jgi:bifunctional non-homologous end joining protein LigD